MTSSLVGSEMCIRDREREEILGRGTEHSRRLPQMLLQVKKARTKKRTLYFQKLPSQKRTSYMLHGINGMNKMNL
eukprot:1585966-Prorocentrum_lima.AAC.1